MPMTPQEKKIRSARTRNLAAVKRSLGLIAEEAAAALATLDNGGVPGGGVFQASVTRYENALAVLAVLAALDVIAGGGEAAPEPEAGIAEVSRDDLGTLVLFVQSLPEAQGMTGDSPLARLRQVAFPFVQPAVPDGEPS